MKQKQHKTLSNIIRTFPTFLKIKRLRKMLHNMNIRFNQTNRFRHKTHQNIKQKAQKHTLKAKTHIDRYNTIRQKQTIIAKNQKQDNQ